MFVFVFPEKEVQGFQTVLQFENPVHSTPKVDYSLPKHGKRTVFNESSDSDSKSDPQNLYSSKEFKFSDNLDMSLNLKRPLGSELNRHSFNTGLPRHFLP